MKVTVAGRPVAGTSMIGGFVRSERSVSLTVASFDEPAVRSETFGTDLDRLIRSEGVVQLSYHGDIAHGAPGSVRPVDGQLLGSARS